jgi:tripartite-type tricarboxylate transporter receptor subunit TctC
MGTARRAMAFAMLVAAAIVASSQRAPAQDAFYRGKSITLVVGYSAGGQPGVIVQNMPGARA